MKKKSVLYSPRLEELKKKKRRAFQLKALVFLIIAAVLLGGLTYGSRSVRVNISTIQVLGNKVVDTEIIKNIATEKMSGYYLRLFPKTNFLLYPRKQIEKELTTQFKRLKSISFDVKNATTLLISVSESEGKYTWCGENPEETSTGEQECYFMDEAGYIFDKAPYFSGDVYFRFYGALNGPSPTGSYFSSEIFKNLIVFKNTIEKMGLKPKAFYVGPEGDIKMFLSGNKIVTESPYIIFKKDADLNQVAENLQAAISTDPLRTDLKNKYSLLLYIDLRFGNKVYFKFR